MNKTKKLPQSKFEIGDTVWVSAEAAERKITDKKWNGHTYMYSFDGTDLRCGEQYLRKILS